MTRISRGAIAKKRRKKIFKITEGFRGSHSKLFRTANQQAMKSLQYAYFDRRKKKRNYKSIWIRRINAASKLTGISYNKTINTLKKRKVQINKKILSEIIIHDLTIFKKLIKI